MNFEILLSLINEALREVLHDDIESYDEILVDFNERVYDALVAETSVLDALIDVEDERSVLELIDDSEKLLRDQLLQRESEFDAELYNFDSSF